MFDEEGRPVQVPVALGDRLDDLSEGDMEERLDALRAEIDRVNAELNKKRAGRLAAEAVFGKQ